MPGVERRGRPRWRLAALAAVLAVSLGVAIAEVGLRVAGVATPQFYRWDEDTGTGLRPGAEGWWTRESRQWIRINPDGLRDDVHDLRKPADTLRIAVLGDSYAEAFQVALEDTFWNRLEADLAACPAIGRRRVEAVNFGVAGYGTAQELQVLRTRVPDYRPDVVLLAFLPTNDVRNNSRVLQGDPYRPYFVLDGGRLELDARFRREPGFVRRRGVAFRAYAALVARSRLLQLISEARARWSSRRSNGDEDRALEPGLDAEVFRAPTDEAWEEAWRVTEALIVEIDRETRDLGARPFIVSLTSGIGVDPDPRGRQRLSESLGVPDLSYPSRRLARLAEEHGLEILDLEPPMRELAARTGQQWHGFGSALGTGHWNKAGHRAAGRILAEWICERIGSGGAGEDAVGPAIERQPRRFGKT